MASFEMISSALHALPRASGPNACIMVADLLSKIDAALPRMYPLRITPWPPKPPILISVLGMVQFPHFIRRDVPVTVLCLVVIVHGFDICRAYLVNKLADDDLAL